MQLVFLSPFKIARGNRFCCLCCLYGKSFNVFSYLEQTEPCLWCGMCFGDGFFWFLVLVLLGFFYLVSTLLHFLPADNLTMSIYLFGHFLCWITFLKVFLILLRLFLIFSHSSRSYPSNKKHLLCYIWAILFSPAMYMFHFQIQEASILSGGGAGL